MFSSKGRQLTYCTNVHPGENWNITFENLKKFVPRIKKNVSPDAPFGLGLRLSRLASQELGLGSKFSEFKDWLHHNDTYVFTMNGFPYGNFHGVSVKDKVHEPDWTTFERLDYTNLLFSQLTQLLPKGMSGGISTSPISYKHWHTTQEERQEAFTKGAEHMVHVALELFTIEQNSGHYLHLDIEPEPDGLLENSAEVVDFFNDYLIPQGRVLFGDKFGLSIEESDAAIKRYLTVCYDICHFSLAFEEPKETFKKLKAHQIQIGKIQISSALKVLFDQKDNTRVWQALSQFDEPVYLHQVTKVEAGTVITYPDLSSVLETKNEDSELRAHFHVPIFLEKFEPLYATQDHIVKVLELLKQEQISEHLEIETYTWDVLPQALKLELSDSIVREFKWLQKRL